MVECSRMGVTRSDHSSMRSVEHCWRGSDVQVDLPRVTFIDAAGREPSCPTRLVLRVSGLHVQFDIDEAA